ncbi:MAG: aldehyde dehydrogenase family protein [Rhodoglobus sp.]
MTLLENSLGLRPAAGDSRAEYRLIIGGREVDASDGATFVTIDPATAQPLATVARATLDDVDTAVAAARHAFDATWRHTSATDRGRLLQAAARRLLDMLEPLAELEAQDSGKPLSQTRSDVRMAARYLEFFGNAAAGLNGDHIPVGPDVIDFTVRQPFGVSAQINAWNFPINMAARSVGAALAAGNTVVVKTPELTPLTTTVLGLVLLDVGVPAGVVNIIHGAGSVVGDALSKHPDVDLITFTGSIETGKKVATSAAQSLTPAVMELGGKSPVLVFADADIAKVARALAEGFVEANGQSCDLPSLAIVHRDVHDEFVAILTARVREFTIAAGVADPDVSALISHTQLNRVTEFVTGAINEGATVVVGGARASGAGLDDGFFFEPTVLTNVTPEMRVAREEIFGPVLSILQFEDDAEVVAIANGTEYGLAAFVWTSNIARGMRMTKLIDAGQVYVNCFSSGDGAMVPFGGFKSSGYGREKGVEALRTYSQIKNVCISTS